MSKNTKPAIPGSIVAVDKKFGREVLVGVADTNNIVTHGFDIDVANPANAFFADVHYRAMRHGPFSVLVGAASPVEVRVLLDGKLLAEKRLDPRPQTLSQQGDSPVMRQVKEIAKQPQPFFINTANDGASMLFTPDPQGRTAEERVRMQLHPDRLSPVSGPSTVRVGEDPTAVFHSKMDVNPLGAGDTGQKPIAPPTKPDGHELSAESHSEETPAEGEAVAATTSGGADSQASDSTPAAATPASQAPAGTQNVAPWLRNAQAPGAEAEELPLPKTWGESQGLIAVGVRMLQVAVEGEPLMPPDGFTYVLFQLNTWEDHARIRANLHSRIKLPKMTPYKEFMDDPEPVQHPTGCSCGLNHNHDPRRFR